MLLHRQRPRVVPNAVLVIHEKQNLMEITRGRRMSVKDDFFNYTRDKEERVERRIDFKCPPNEESFEVDRMVSLVLAEKQPGNQKTAKHKK